MKLKNHKKTLQFVFYVSLILGSMVSTKIPSTYSYFSRSEDNSLVYQSQLYNLYDELSMQLESAAADNAKFRFSFQPSKILKEGETDSYTITIPNACFFEKVTVSPSTVLTEPSAHTRVISYSKSSNRSVANYIYISCAIDKSADVLDFTSTVTSTIHEMNHTFLYKKYSYKEDYEEYLGRVNGTVESSGPITSTSADDLYNKFLKWVSTYTAKVGYNEAITHYLTQVYKNGNDLKNPDKFHALEGFSIEYDQKKNTYTFQVLNNFVGYARTYEQNKQSSTSVTYVYFSTNTKVRLNQALRHYLYTYLYPTSPTSASLVYDYILNNGGIYSVILNGNRMTGLSLSEYHADTLYSTVRMDKSLLLSMALSVKEKMPCIAISDYDGMRYTNFRYALNTTAASLGISTDMAKTIYNRADIASSATKNNTATTPSSFTDYFIQQDGSRFLLIRVSSDITKEPLYNKMTITPITTVNGMGITFTNIDSSLKVHITYTNKSDVLQVVTQLNNYFGTSISEGDFTVLVNTNDEYTIEYTFAK